MFEFLKPFFGYKKVYLKQWTAPKSRFHGLLRLYTKTVGTPMCNLDVVLDQVCPIKGVRHVYVLNHTFTVREGQQQNWGKGYKWVKMNGKS